MRAATEQIGAAVAAEEAAGTELQELVKQKARLEQLQQRVRLQLLVRSVAAPSASIADDGDDLGLPPLVGGSSARNAEMEEGVDGAECDVSEADE